MGIKIIKGTTYWYMPLDFGRKVRPKEYKSPVINYGPNTKTK